MLAKKAFPRPCPSWAPGTRPAMSTTSKAEGTLDLGWYNSHNHSYLSSGRGTRGRRVRSNQTNTIHICVRLNSTKGIVLSFGLCLGQQVEQAALSNVWQTFSVREDLSRTQTNNTHLEMVLYSTEHWSLFRSSLLTLLAFHWYRAEKKKKPGKM